MPQYSSWRSVALAYALTTLGVMAVGLVDYVTGSEIHVVSLYFVPLAIASWRLGRTGAVFASLLSTLVWLLALYKTSPSDTQPYILALNFLTQGTAFLTVSILFAWLAQALQKEKLHGRTDALTGLNNRQAFIEQATVALAICQRHTRPVSLAYIDLDNFKSVNDSWGHAQGDALLCSCARLISDGLRSNDIAARFGGDEFVIFLPETGRTSAQALLERIRHALGNSEDFRSVGVTASIGAVIDEGAGSDIGTLLKRADAQMYAVKHDSKNRVAICCVQNTSLARSP